MSSGRCRRSTTCCLTATGRGASTLLAGPLRGRQDADGAALHLRRRTPRRNRLCIATFQENPDPARADPARVSRGRCDDPGVELMYRTPVDLYHRRMGLRPARHRAAHRCHAGSPSTASATCELAVPEMNSASASTSTRCCSAAPARTSASIMTQEVPDLFGVSRLSEYGISHLSDNVILLQFIRGDSRLKRALTDSQGARERP